jgi:hypothetical protein
MKDMLERVALAKVYCTSDENMSVEAIERAILDSRVSYPLNMNSAQNNLMQTVLHSLSGHITNETMPF